MKKSDKSCFKKAQVITAIFFVTVWLNIKDKYISDFCLSLTYESKSEPMSVENHGNIPIFHLDVQIRKIGRNLGEIA